MNKEWKNSKYNDEIGTIYNIFNIEIMNIISIFFETTYNGKIVQILPNKFGFNGFLLDCTLNNLDKKGNLIKIEFPSVRVYNGTLSLSIEEAHRKVSQYLYFRFLDEKFDHENFYDQLEKCIGKFCESYQRLILMNFKEIRANYFKDSNRILSPYEIDFFNKPSVLLKCETSEEVTNYGYKAGERRNFIHSYSVFYKDIHEYDNHTVKEYIKKLNHSNPKNSYTEYMEMNPTVDTDSLQNDYFDFELSKKINHYIAINKNSNYNFKFDDIQFDVIIKKSRNNFAKFEFLIIMYVLVFFDFEIILSFLRSMDISRNRNYENIVLLSQYFLNREYSNSIFACDYYKFKNDIFNQLWSSNFGDEDSYNRILSSFKSIGGSSDDLEKIVYFYMNFTSINNREVDYNHVLYIFYNFFKR